MFGGFSEKWKHIEIDIVGILLLAKPGAVDESAKFSQLVSEEVKTARHRERIPLGEAGHCGRGLRAASVMM